MKFLNTEQVDITTNAVIDELTHRTYGEEIPMTQAEIAAWKPIYFEGSGTWGADVDNGGDYSYYWDGKWEMTSDKNKRRVYPLGTLPAGFRSVIYYGKLGLVGKIPIGFHKDFNEILNRVNTWMQTHTCGNCGRFERPPHPDPKVCGFCM